PPPRLDVFANRFDEGLAICDDAIRLAEQLDLDELRANLLTTQATAKLANGQLADAEDLLNQAVALAEPLASPEAARALVNLAALGASSYERDEWRARTDRAAEYATRIGDRRTLLWLEPFYIRGAFVEGDWDQALTRADAYLEAAEALGGHYSARGIYLIRALMLAARGDSASAAADLERGLAGIDEATD